MLFRWERTPDPAWQDTLDSLAPRTERGPAWLKIVWHPGEKHDPVQRWVIYQLIPLFAGKWPMREEDERLPSFLRNDLLGPNPRWFGYYSHLEQRWVRTREFSVDRMQWELFQQTGCYAKPYWIIQGAGGGHRRRWDELETSISLALGGPERPPAMGELPYAEFDNRVIEQLRRYDLVAQYKNRMRDFTGRDLDLEDKQRATEMRKLVWDTLSESLMESMTFTNAELDAIRDQQQRARHALVTRMTPRPIDGDEIKDHFINAA